MEPFADSMFPHRVYFLPNAEGQDAGGSVTETFPATSGRAPLPCRVRLKDSRPGMMADQEVGVTPADLAFPADPGCKKGDRFVQAGAGRLFRALAPARARDADGVLFVASCEVID